MRKIRRRSPPIRRPTSRSSASAIFSRTTCPPFLRRRCGWYVPPRREPHDRSGRRLGVLRATGDLAYKKIFPSLQAMVKRVHLDVPVIGVAKSAWTLEQLKARAKDSLEKHGGLDPVAFGRLCGLLRYVD